MTTRSAAPFWPWNLALMRSVAFWKSVPGTLNSFTSEPWNAAFSPMSATKIPSHVKTTRHGWQAQWPATRARAPVWAIRRSSSSR